MTASKPLVAVGVAALLVLSLLAGVGAVTAQDSGPDWEPPGPFPAEELRQGGVHDPDAPPSARLLGDPVRGSAALRYTPVSPLDSEQKFVSSGQLVETDRVQFYSTAFGEASGEYELVVVYWNDATKTVNGTQVDYADDQTVQRITLDVEEGYATQNIKLRSHYDSTKEVTAWLEKDGDRVEGARWRFTHRSNPLSASPGFPVDGKGDLWKWGTINILLPALPGILIARRGAQHVLDRTIVGPQKGGVWWGLVLGVLTLAAVAVGTWQTAAVLARAPYVVGLFVTLFAFFVFLGFRDTEVERAELNQKDLESVTSVSGDDTKQARSEHIELLDIIRRDGNIYAPQPGLRPFFARYWANPAKVDESDLKTVNNTTGDVSKKYELDPQSDEPLVRTPAHLSFDPTLMRDRDTTDGPSLEAEPDRHPLVESLADIVSRLNVAFLGPAIIGAVVMYYGVMAWIGVPSIAAVAAVLPTAIAGYTAEDGSMELEEAPYHFSEARAVLAHERAQYSESKTFEELQQKIADLDMDEHERVQEFIEAFHDQVNSRLESLQSPSGDPNSTPSTNGQQQPGDD